MVNKVKGEVRYAAIAPDVPANVIFSRFESSSLP